MEFWKENENKIGVLGLCRIWWLKLLCNHMFMAWCFISQITIAYKCTPCKHKCTSNPYQFNDICCKQRPGQIRLVSLSVGEHFILQLTKKVVVQDSSTMPIWYQPLACGVSDGFTCLTSGKYWGSLQKQNKLILHNLNQINLFKCYKTIMYVVIN